MTFLNILLLGGITAASLPLIIHLLSRSRHRIVKWGAMHLLESVLRKNTRRIRLEQLILLLLRTAIPAALALCMARPVLTGVQSLIRNAKSSMVVLLDNSLSMKVGDAVRSNFTLAREEAAMIVDNLPRGSQIAVVGMAGPLPALALSGYDLEATSKGLGKVVGGFGEAAAANALETAAGIFSSRMHHADRELVVMSDFQGTSWSKDQAGARGRVLEMLRAQPIPPRIVLFRVGREVDDNVSVQSLELSRSLVGVNQKIKIRANIRNFGKTDYLDLRVYFRVDGKERSVSQISLKPEGATQVLFTHRFDEPGSHMIEVYADADALKEDNSRYASIPVLDQLPVLLVSGDTNPEPLRSETAFLEIALQPFGAGGTELKDLIVLSVVADTKLDAQKLSAVRVVVLANVRQLTESQLRALDDFVRNGGGLAVFPGDRVNAAWYNSKLTAGGKGMLPFEIVALGGGVTGNTQAAAIVSRHYEHPALQLFNDPRSGSLHGAEILLWYRLRPPEGAPVGGSENTVIARLDTGDPFLIEKEYGEGRVFQCCVPCDADWSNIPMRSFYLPLMQQIMVHLASDIYPPRNVEVGQPVAAFLPLADAGKTAVLTGPGGVKHELKISKKGMRALAEFNDTDQAGIYTLVTPAGETIHFAVNTPPGESNLTRLSGEELKSLAEETGGRIVGSWKEYRDLDRSRRFGQEIWTALLWFVLILIFTELFLVQYLKGRRAA